MKIFEGPKPATLLVSALLGLAAASATADMPKGEYACHVVAKGGTAAFVLVQADDRKEAKAMAMRNPATTLDGYPVAAHEFVECISPPKEKFRDSSFQYRFENADL